MGTWSSWWTAAQALPADTCRAMAVILLTASQRPAWHGQRVSVGVPRPEGRHRALETTGSLRVLRGAPGCAHRSTARTRSRRAEDRRAACQLGGEFSTGQGTGRVAVAAPRLRECSSSTEPPSVHSLPALTTPPGRLSIPFGVGQMVLFEPEVHNLRRPHCRVVHATEERLRVRAATALLGNRREQPGDLGRVGNGSWVHPLVDRWSVPPEPVEGVLREATFLHSDIEDFVERSPLARAVLAAASLPSSLRHRTSSASRSASASARALTGREFRLLVECPGVQGSP